MLEEEVCYLYQLFCDMNYHICVQKERLPPGGPGVAGGQIPVMCNIFSVPCTIGFRGGGLEEKEA